MSEPTEIPYSLAPAPLIAAAIVLVTLAIWCFVVLPRSAGGGAPDRSRVAAAGGVAALAAALGVSAWAASVAGSATTAGAVSLEARESATESAPASVPAAGGESAPLTPTPIEVAVASPTATARPTATPRPRPTARPTATPPPVLEIMPLPTVAPGVFEFQQVGVGPVRLDVYDGVQFTLGTPRAVYSTRGLAGFALGRNFALADLSQNFANGEVDVFVPYRTVNGRSPDRTPEVVAGLRAANVDVELVGQIVVDGHPTQIYDLSTASAEPFLVFDTDAATVGVANAGWFAASGRSRMWVIEAPDGPLVVTAEVRNDSTADFEEVVALAEDILFTMTIL